MAREVVPIKKTVNMKHVGKEGLSRVDGKKVHDDSWLHEETEEDTKSFTRWVNSTYRTNKIEQKSTEKSLIIDLVKGQLNKTKLIRKMVQVRGKNGKVFTRMQWVDPNTGQPVSKPNKKQEENTRKIPKSKPQEPVEHHLENDSGQSRVQPIKTEVTKNPVFDESSQKGFIDKAIHNMNKKDKEHLIAKFDIKWKHNDYEGIDWKNAVMALKQFMYDNPHHIDASHLPKDITPRTPEGTDKINDFVNRSGRQRCYELIKEFNLGDGVDPTLIKEYASKKEGGDGTGFIKNMHQMMQLKAYLKDNPHLMGDVDYKPKEEIAGSKLTSKVKSTAQKGGNTIEGVLKILSDTEKYDLMREHGIADSDPRLNPLWSKEKGNNTGGTRHMAHMIALKKLIVLNPHILSKHLDGEDMEQETARLKAMNEKQKVLEGIKAIIGKLPKEAKAEIMKRYKDSPEIQNRVTNDSPNIDNMRAMEALQRLLISDPDKLKEVQGIHDKHVLLNTKISNKQIEKILRSVVGLTSRNIDYAKIQEKGKEWGFGIASFTRIQENEDGEPVLSVVDAGDDGTDWFEYEYPMTEIRDFMSGIIAKPKATLIPIHKKSPLQIEQTLNSTFGAYTDLAGDIMKKEMAKFWKASGNSNNVQMVSANANKLYPGTIIKLLQKWDIPVNENYGTFDTGCREWKLIAYADQITKTKEGDANTYIVANGSISDPFPLLESAKNWTSKERSTARKEMIHSRITIGDVADLPDAKVVHARISTHIRNSTDFVPFDLLTACLCSPNMEFVFPGKDAKGKISTSCSYSTESNKLIMSHQYLTSPSFSEVTTRFKPVGLHPFHIAMSHEFAHAIDGFLSGNQPNTVLQWDNETGKKYLGEHFNCVGESYVSKVASSNPDKQVVEVKGENQSYYWHKDEWMNSYEGRIYDPSIKSKIGKERGNLCDFSYIPHSYQGVEHWSENVSVYAAAFHEYRDWLKQNPPPVDDDGNVEESYTEPTLDRWAKDMNDEYKSMNLGDDWTAEEDPSGAINSFTEGKNHSSKKSYNNRNSHLPESAGYMYHELKSRYPILSGGIHHAFNRPDFIEDTKTSTPKKLYHERDFARKSENLYILEG